MNYRTSFTLMAVGLSASVASSQTGPDSGPNSVTGDLDPTVVVAEDPESPADEPYVNTVVGLGNKLPYSIFETPRGVETVTREQFEERGAQNLEEAARYVPGVQSAYYGLDTRQDFIRIRGLQSLNYRDGLQYNYNFYNNTPQEAYAIDQIDFIKGPASILFGRGTVGGTVNTSSKIAGPDATNEVMVGYGTDSRFQTGLDYNVALNDDETVFLRMVGYYRDSDTYVDFVNDDAMFFMPSLTWQPTEDTSLTFLMNLQENDSKPSLVFFPNEATLLPGFDLSNSRYLGEPSIDRYDTDQIGATMLFDHKFNDCWSISSTLRYTESSADYVEHTLVPPAIGNAFIFPLPPGTYHRILYGADHDMDVFSGNVVLNAKHETGPLSHDIRLGFDFANADRDFNTLPPNGALFGLPYVYANPINVVNPVYGVGAVPLPARSFSRTTTEELYGFFLHDRIEWNDLIVSAGVRYDDYSLESSALPTDDQGEWTFDFGLMYQLPNGVSPYYSYAESFEPQGIDTVTGAPYKPKEGTQHEIGVKWMPCEETLLVASYFQIEEANRVFSGPIVTTQSSSVEVDGAEFSIRQRFHDFYFLGSYTYLDTANNDIAGSPELAGVPSHQASAWITYRPEAGALEGFRAGFGVRFTGRTSDGRDMVETASNTLFDAMIGYEWESFDVQLSASNIFNRQYVQTRDTTQQLPGGPLTTSAFLGQDRAINLTARYRF